MVSSATIDGELNRLALACYALAVAELVGAAVIFAAHANLLGFGPFRRSVFYGVWAAVATPLAIYEGVMAPLTLIAGRRIAQRRWLRFCVAVGRANLLAVPWGTMVALYSSRILSRRSVADRFGEGDAENVVDELRSPASDEVFLKEIDSARKRAADDLRFGVQAVAMTIVGFIVLALLIHVVLAVVAS
jgi:hypothetical protein